MHPRSLRKTRPVLECLEGRRVLSTGVFVSNVAGHVHGHGLAVRQRPSPIIAQLTPNQTAIDITSATFDPRSKVITIQGTVVAPMPQNYLGQPVATPPTTATATMSIYASQATSRRSSVSASVYADGINAKVGQKSPFEVRFVADQGYFTRGQIYVNIYTYFYSNDGGGNYFPWTNAKMILRLRNV